MKQDDDYEKMPLSLLDTMTSKRFTFDITDPDSPLIPVPDDWQPAASWPEPTSEESGS